MSHRSKWKNPQQEKRKANSTSKSGSVKSNATKSPNASWYQANPQFKTPSKPVPKSNSTLALNNSTKNSTSFSTNKTFSNSSTWSMCICIHNLLICLWGDNFSMILLGWFRIEYNRWKLFSCWTFWSRLGLKLWGLFFSKLSLLILLLSRLKALNKALLKPSISIYLDACSKKLLKSSHRNFPTTFKLSPKLSSFLMYPKLTH